MGIIGFLRMKKDRHANLSCQCLLIPSGREKNPDSLPLASAYGLGHNPFSWSSRIRIETPNLATHTISYTTSFLLLLGLLRLRVPVTTRSTTSTPCLSFSRAIASDTIHNMDLHGISWTGNVIKHVAVLRKVSDVDAGVYDVDHLGLDNDQDCEVTCVGDGSPSDIGSICFDTDK